MTFAGFRRQTRIAEAMIDQDFEPRIRAFARFNGDDARDAELMQDNRDETRFCCGQREYLVLDDDEATEKAREYIEESLWAFNAGFILDHINTNGENYERLERSLQKMQEELCESANPLIRARISDLDEFTDDAISADGRGHFMSTYDGDEHEVEIDGRTFYIYRIN